MCDKNIIMPKPYDFSVKHDFETESNQDLSKKIIKAMWLNRLKRNKPVVIFVGGKSGEGKSYTVIRIQEILCELQNLDIFKYFDVMNVYTPIQYPEKLQEILNNKEYKKVNIIAVQEAREVVKAKNWSSFLTQAIADINALVRTQRRMCIILVSQSLKDITKEIRYTIDYYCKVARPGHNAARLFIDRLYMDERDLENLKLKKRRVWGFVQDPKGRKIKLYPEFIELSLPDKRLTEIFDKQDFESKGQIIRDKTNKLIEEIKKDMDIEDKRVNQLVDHYISNIDQLLSIGKQTKKGWRANKEFREMYKLGVQESREFENLLNIKLKEKGVLEDGI